MPTENVKQKMQAGMHGTVAATMDSIVKTSGYGGFYTGFVTTVLREVPFALIQFPLYEQLKVMPPARERRYLTESIICGTPGSRPFAKRALYGPSPEASEPCHNSGPVSVCGA